MRTLIIILGQVRASEMTWSSFKENVADVVNADIAVCVGESSDNNDSNPYWLNAKYKWVSEEFEDFGDGFESFFETGSFDPNWRRILAVGDQWLGGVKGDLEHPGSAGILIYFRYLALSNLIKYALLEEYDCFIVTRSDYVWNCKHPKVEKLDGRKMWFPFGEFHGGLTDRHVICFNNDIINYLSILPPILFDTDKLINEMMSHKNMGIWNLERYIEFRLLGSIGKNRIRFFPFAMYSVRSESVPTRWSQGVYSERLGCFIKYPEELWRSKLTLNYASINRQPIVFNNLFLTLYLRVLYKFRKFMLKDVL